MAIDVECPRCHRSLKVADEHAGRNARCPDCGETFEAAARQHVPEVPPEEAWHLKTPEGRVYGPAPEATMRAWVDEGRVSEDCEVRQGSGPWRKADDVYPELRPVEAAVAAAEILSPFRETGEADAIPLAEAVEVSDEGNAAAFSSDASPGTGDSEQQAPASQVETPPAPDVAGPDVAAPPQVVYMQTHRGGLILFLAILGAGCPPFAFMAWTMGAADLEEIRQGRMDPSGYGPTAAGHFFGMFFSILCIVVLVAALFWLLFYVAQ